MGGIRICHYYHLYCYYGSRKCPHQQQYTSNRRRYIDAIGGQGLSSQSLLSQISQSSLPSIKLERLYRRARISGRHCWGEEYPEDAILDDVENYRPLEFLHHGLLMRSRIWQLAVARHAGKDGVETPESLFEELIELGEVRILSPQPPNTCLPPTALPRPHPHFPAIRRRSIPTRLRHHPLCGVRLLGRCALPPDNASQTADSY
jgi:hypothetical protein